MLEICPICQLNMQQSSIYQFETCVFCNLFLDYDKCIWSKLCRNGWTLRSEKLNDKTILSVGSKQIQVNKFVEFSDLSKFREDFGYYDGDLNGLELFV
jgi:hypothetical protein